MFNSPILDVAFGLMFSFLAISLAAGTIYEAVASVAKLRSKTLLSGIKTLVNDPTASGLVPQTSAAWLMLAGWLLSGLSALFEAPFWFDTLQQVARLKGSGPSPAEKKSGDSAAA
jgi:hypothetical protein